MCYLASSKFENIHTERHQKMTLSTKPGDFFNFFKPVLTSSRQVIDSTILPAFSLDRVLLGNVSVPMVKKDNLGREVSEEEIY